MLVILAPKSHETDDLQVNQMALLAALVDLMLISYFQSSVRSRSTHTPSYAVTSLKYRHLQTLLREHLGTPQS